MSQKFRDFLKDDERVYNSSINVAMGLLAVMFVSLVVLVVVTVL